jgi:hypothetical protein
MEGASHCDFRFTKKSWSMIPKSLSSDLIRGWMPVFG